MNVIRIPTPYEKMIEDLIPFAEVAADKAIAHIAALTQAQREDVWNEAFHGTIDRLATNAGIRRQSWQK